MGEYFKPYYVLDLWHEGSPVDWWMLKSCDPRLYLGNWGTVKIFPRRKSEIRNPASDQFKKESKKDTK